MTRKTKKKIEEDTVESSFDALYAKYKKGDSVYKAPESLEKVDPSSERLIQPFVSFDRFLGGGPAKGDITTYSGFFSTGKCLGIDTPVYMFDGSIKMSQDIEVGDVLMGPDNTPRNVLSVCTGQEEMYWIRQKRGEDYRVNGSHILSLKHNTPVRYSRYTDENGKRHYDPTKVIKSATNQVVNISVNDILPLTKKSDFKARYRGYKAGPLMFDNKKHLEIDPYILGVWLGDGTSTKPEISNTDPEVVEALYAFSETNGGTVSVYEKQKCPRYNIVTKKGQPNPFLFNLKGLNLISNKHIPEHYLKSSYENRVQLLSGLLDTDGYRDRGRYEITQKSKQLSLDICRLARSLGFIASIVPKIGKISSIGFEGLYWRMIITGDMSILNMKVPHKIISEDSRKRNYYGTGFEIEPDGIGDYYGFEIDGDHLFVLGDGTVTHNTSLALEMAKLNPEMKIGFLDAEYNWKDSSYLWIDKLYNIEKERIFVMQPAFLEEGANMIVDLCNACDIVIFDGFDTLPPEGEYLREMNEDTMALQARAYKKFFRKSARKIDRSGAALIITNHLYENIGNIYEPLKEPGGKAVSDYACQKLFLTRGNIKDKTTKEVLGQEVRVNVHKDKLTGNRGKKFSLDYNNRTGFDATADLISNALDFNIITQKGAWYGYDGENIAQGLKNTKALVEDNPDFGKELKDRVLEAIKIEKKS